MLRNDAAVRRQPALSKSERAELERLRKENVELRMQRDVVRRSVALWVNEGDGPVAVARFIALQWAEHGVPRTTACRALGVSPAWFDKWRDGDALRRRARREQLGDPAAATARRGRYGSPRITADLREVG